MQKYLVLIILALLLVPAQVRAQRIAGWQHTLALRADGTLWAWGNNFYGQLGDGSATDKPLPVMTTLPARLTAVFIGMLHSLALDANGTLWAWGGNGSGQLGDGTKTNSPLPVRITLPARLTAVAGGNSFSLALDANGKLWAWGFNDVGQLGDGTTTERLLPGRITHSLDTDPALAGDQPPLPARFTAVACGMAHSLALASDGSLWAWGYNSSGQLGDGTTTRSLLPVKITHSLDTDPALPGDQPPLPPRFTAVAGGYAHSLALASDGSLWAWGENSSGQLGDGTATNRLLPVKITHSLDTDPALPGDQPPLPARFTAVAGGYAHSLALAEDGSLWAWGWNGRGQLGDGTTTNRPLPVKITHSLDTDPALPGDQPPLPARFAAVACGEDHSLALASDGSLWAWGYNSRGQLGDGSSTNRLLPVLTRGPYPDGKGCLDLDLAIFPPRATGERPFTVSFASLHSPFSRVFEWDFGDGHTSTDESPSHTFATLGSHTVTLAVDVTANGTTSRQETTALVHVSDEPGQDSGGSGGGCSISPTAGPAGSLGLDWLLLLAAMLLVRLRRPALRKSRRAN